MRWLKWTAAGLLGVLVVGAAAGWAWVQRTLPQTAGVLALQGAPAGLRIERDAHGIPTVHAPTLQAAAYGLGVAHAQDRLWQMETHRRIGAGRVAQAFGPAALETDRFLRALGVRRAAQAQWDALADEPRALLQAYADGVNAVIATLRARPPEFVILGLHPEPWDPVDSLAWGIMMAWDLGGNWNTELLRLRLALQMPVDRINQLLPPYPGRQPLPTADYAALYRGLGLGTPPAQKAGAAPAVDTATATDPATAWHRLTETAPPSGVEGVGSNNWVLAGSRSTTGRPLLANDPHLKLSAPALWYFARVVVGGGADAGQAVQSADTGLRAAGATLPGLPLVVLGQTQHVAWGYTNTGPDVQDLYIEEVDPEDPGRYRTPEGWARFETRSEVIQVKGAADVPITVRRSRHGPVISDAGTADDVLAPAGGGSAGTAPRHVLALRWTALDADAESVSAGLGFLRARSVADYLAASRTWVAPMQSMVVADNTGPGGRIALVAPGRVPLRRPDHDLHGLAPAPGWDARYDWAGFVPADETPREFDPARGYIATANQRIVGDDYPHFLGEEWALPYRQRRIEQLLDAQPRHGLDDLARIQADVRSLAAPRLLPALQRAGAESAHPLAAAARQALQGFDGEMAADRAAPLIFWAWQRQLSRGLFADDAGPLFDKSLATRSFNDALEGVLARDDATWCDDRTTPAAETCAQQSGAALTRALDELQARFGADVAQWRWGSAHIARSEHRPFSNVGALARFFELRTPVGGDTYTVNVSRVGLRPDKRTGELYLDEHGPSLRALYDLAEPAKSRVMHSTGQSGNPFSPQYRSFVEPWRAVQYLPLWPDSPSAEVLQIEAAQTAP